MNVFFNNKAWFGVLEKAFNAKTVEKEINGKTHVLSIFPYKGLKIAFPKFPIGVDIEDIDLYLPGGIMQKLAKKSGAQLLRLTGPNEAFKADIQSNLKTLPTTEIENLKEWRLSKLSSSIRRNIKKSMKQGVSVSFEQSDEDLSEKIYEIYLQTIAANDGNARYKITYFNSLIEAINQNIGLKLIVARNSEAEVIAYMIIVEQARTAFYLHGGVIYEHQHLRPMDSMFHFAISSVQAEGMEKFNMLMSPQSQKGLIRYKEKWGGTTTLSSTYTYAFNPILNFLFKLYDRVS